MRKLAIFAFSFAGAVMLSQYLLPSLWQIILFASCIFMFIAGMFLRGSTRLAVMIIALGAAVGFGWNCFYSAVFFAPALELDGIRATVPVETIDFPETKSYGFSVDMKVKLDSGRKVKAVVYFYDDSAKDLEPGDTVTLTGDFSRADMFYDEYTGALTSKGYYLTVRGAEITNVVYNDDIQLEYIHRYASKTLQNVIENIFPEKTRGFIQALLTGNRFLINEDHELTGAMQGTGVYHVIAVSGLHVSVLTGFFFFIFGKRKSVLICIIPTLLLFMGISGFTPSVVRAVIMQFFFLAAPLLKRESDSLTSLSAALLIIFLFDPFAAKSVGLQLSFGAMLGMILVTPRMNDFFAQRKSAFFKRTRIGRGLFKTFIGGFSASVGALVFTMPLTAIYFGYVSVIAPVVNILILWAVSLAFCAGLAAVAAGVVFVPLGSLLAWGASVPAEYITWLVKAAARISFASIYLDTLPTILWFIFIYLIVFLFAICRLKARYMIIPACAAVVSLAAILVVRAEINSAERGISAAVLDVGQGQSIVITSGDYTAVIDCGSSSGENAGEIAYRYLSSIGRTSVDLLVLTHYHDDHANGANYLLKRMDVIALAAPVPDYEDSTLDDEIIAVAKNSETDVIYVDKDIEAELGKMMLTMYAPLGSISENERCVCVLASEDDFDFLVTGDIGTSIERIFVEHAYLPDVESMVVGHHGSKYSTSDELLMAVMPETAVISSGENYYGHPAQETISRLVSFGIEVYRTDEYGTIIIKQEK